MTIIDEILRGEYDDDLEALVAAVKERHSIVRAAKAAVALTEMVPGKTRVRLTGLSPKYLNGMLGTVVGAKARSRNRVQVQLDGIHRRKASRFCGMDGIITAPASCLDRLPDPDPDPDPAV